jgi:hypothetical protein
VKTVTDDQNEKVTRISNKLDVPGLMGTTPGRFVEYITALLAAS